NSRCQIVSDQVVDGASPLSRGRSEISESGAAVGDLGRTRQDAPLAGRTTEVRQADRRLPDQARCIGRSASPTGLGLLNPLTQGLHLGQLSRELCGPDWLS